MCLGPLCLCVGVDVLCVLWSSPPQAVLYGRPPDRLRRTPPRLTASRWAFFYDPFTQLGRHLLHITVIHSQFLCNLLIREIQSHEIQTQHPYFQRLMMSHKNSVRQVIKACVTGGTLIALTGQFRIIKAALDDLFGPTRGTLDAVWPTQLADSLITLTIINQIFDVHLHRWTPVRVWDMGWHQCTRSSHPRPWNPI